MFVIGLLAPNNVILLNTATLLKHFYRLLLVVHDNMHKLIAKTSPAAQWRPFSSYAESASAQKMTAMHRYSNLPTDQNKTTAITTSRSLSPKALHMINKNFNAEFTKLSKNKSQFIFSH